MILHIETVVKFKVPYFLKYRMSSVIKRSFFLPKQIKNLDPSYKTDLDLRHYLGMAKLVLLQKIGLIYKSVVILETGIHRLIAE